MGDKETIRTETQQYVGFILAGEEYGVPILRVQEIIRYTDLTRVPQSSAFVEGVLNLRGKVIPVINLRQMFSLPDEERDIKTRIVVVEVDSQTVGLIVDEVSEVLTITGEDIEPAPALGGDIRSDCITGMGKIEDRLMILLDLGKLLGTEEKASLEALATV